eukprot:14890987-Ditylum_brightwellii.AAC.1
MDVAYTLVQEQLRSDTLMVFNNEQATFKEQTADNLEHCLNAVMVHIFLNKAYTLQKWVIKSNNYLTEFPTPPRVETKKMNQKEILEVLENRIPTL